MAAIIPISVASTMANEVVVLLAEPLRALQEEVAAFRRKPVTPERTCAFEKKRRRFFGRPAW